MIQFLIIFALLWQAPVYAANDTVKDVDPAYFESHIKNIKKRLNWGAPPARADNPKDTQAIITFRLDKNGTASSMQILKSSGIKSFDEYCLKNIEKRSPFRPFPKALIVEAVFKPLDVTITVKEDVGVNEKRL